MTKAEAVKNARIKELTEDELLDFIYFKGISMWRGQTTKGYKVLASEDFARECYGRFAGISKSNIDDLLHAMRTTAPDCTSWGNLIAFGDKIWDMQKLDFIGYTTKYVYSSDTVPHADTTKPWEFLLQLANGDENLANDYLQAMAPLAMMRKPTGVVWFVGSGSNGKSSLINALYRILGKYFASMTTSAIEDGRDSPRLNGIIGNICRESSESRVDDTERYKAIGTHEPFTVHKFHSQESMVIDTGFHTIFNANNIPVFSDKTKGARRRTLIVPFPATFEDNPSFEDVTFTPEFLGGMVTLILETTHTIKANAYRYNWSVATLKAKDAYDSEVNSAEAFIQYLTDKKVYGFLNYNILKMNYDNWCSHNGLVPLGVTTLKRTINTEIGVVRKQVRLDSGSIVHRYQFEVVAHDNLIWIDGGYGVLTEHDAKPEPEPKEKQSVLEKGW